MTPPNFKALTGLLTSKKAVMCLLILTVSTVALFLHRMDGTSFAAVCGVVATIYNYAASKTDCAALQAQAPQAQSQRLNQ